MLFFGYELFFQKNLFDKSFSDKKLLIEETEVEVSSLPHTLTLVNNQNREVFIQSSGSFDKLSKENKIIFFIEGIAQFTWKISDNKIYFFRYNNSSKDLIDYWLLHLVLPLKITFQNKLYFLHAGSVSIDDENVILFCAESYGGKSTLTDFFLKKNHILLSDDKVGVRILENDILATPSYPYHRPYRKMEDLGIRVDKFLNKEMKIESLFNLIKGDPKADIKIESVCGIDKFKVMKFSTDIDLFSIYKKERFKTLSELANKVDIYNITIPWDLDRLEEVYQTIIEFIKNKKGTK